MPQLTTPENLQKMEFDVKTSEGDSRITIVSGRLPIYLAVSSTSNSTVTQTASFKALLDPTLGPGKFRKATAIASAARIDHWENASPANFFWEMREVEATLDDEEGRVQLVVDLMIGCSGTNNNMSARGIEFQVTTLAVV